MKKNGHRIIKVNPDSIAWEMGVEPGMYLVSVNGVDIEDVFDYQYLMDEEEIDVLIREENGEETLLEIEKDPDEDFGVEFENSLMDEYRSCCNHCIFCFIDQMPPGMRETLYFKDDDSRLSFLQGNYVTLTNMKDRDIDRIIRYHMEPINISVHTTNPELRRKMLGNRFAGDIFPKVQRLCDAGITMNGQIVLCRGVNDGEELDRSIRDLAGYRPAMQSVSVVPVGLTKYRQGLAKLTPFDRESAGEVIDLIEKWQRTFVSENPDAISPHFIHASDEWYILAGRELPEEDRYDGYLQLENGVGMVRLMETEIRDALEGMHDTDLQIERKVTVVTGFLIRDYIEKFANLVADRYPGLDVRVRAIRNDFFGNLITVSGLVTGRDLIAQLKEIQDSSDTEPLGEEILIPVNMLRSGEKVFLDDITTDDVEKELGLPVRVVWSGGEKFVRALLGLSNSENEDRQIYEL